MDEHEQPSFGEGDFLFEDPAMRRVGHNILRYPKVFMRELMVLHMVYTRKKISFRDYVAGIILNKAAWDIFKIEVLSAPTISLKKNGEPRKIRKTLRELCEFLGISIPEGSEIFATHKVDLDGVLRKLLHVSENDVFDEDDDYVRFIDADGKQTTYHSIWEKDKGVFMILSDLGIATYRRLRICFERYHPIARDYQDWENVSKRRSASRFLRSRRSTLEKSLNYEIPCYNFYERYFALITMYHYAVIDEPISDNSLDLNMKIFGTRRSKRRITLNRFDLHYVDPETEERFTLAVTENRIFAIEGQERHTVSGRCLNALGHRVLKVLSRIYQRETEAFESLKKTYPDTNFEVWEDELPLPGETDA